MRKVQIIALIIALFFVSCKSNQKKTAEKNTKNIAVDKDHSPEMALDWDGTYKGLLPCASCPGILTSLKLNNDKTFVKLDYYLESKGGFFREEGTFSFTKEGNKIILKPKKGATTMYAVGENRLIMLDQNGKKSTSKLAKMYELSKVADNDLQCTQNAVKGMLVLGHEVATFSPCGTSKVYWISDTKNGQLHRLYKSKVGAKAAPYTPVMAELVVSHNGKAKDGFAADYDGVLKTVSIKSVEIITPDNYCK